MSSTAEKTLIPCSRHKLHGYQNRMVSFIHDTPKAALFAEMGLGKTVATLTALADLFDAAEVTKVLIIAPLRVAEHTWPAEIANWPHVSHLTFSVLTGVKAKREAAAQAPAQIHITNRENLVWLVELWGKKWPYDMVVIDESSSFKSSKAQRFKALRRALPHIDRMVQLTGTPASNGLLDLWPQMFLLDRGERLGKTFSGFRSRYFESDYMGFKWTPRPNAQTEIEEKVGDVCLTLAAADYLNMPNFVENDIFLPLPAKLRAQYDELEKEFLLQLEDETVTAFNAAALSSKLRQFCNGALYTQPDSDTFAEVHDLKLKALASVIDEANGAPVLVAYSFKSDAARIEKAFPQAQRISADNIDQWNAGEVPLMLAHPASAGHGLNLQHGGNVLVWFGLNWSLELYQQFNARLFRQGQTKPVFCHRLSILESVDEAVKKALDQKDVTQANLLNALKQEIGGRQKWQN